MTSSGNTKCYEEVIAEHIKRFKAFFVGGLNQIKEACKIYVDCLDMDVTAGNMFRDACPEIPVSVWASLELVGRGAMDSRLLWGGGIAAGILRKIPVSEQSRILDNGVEVAVGDDDKRLVPVSSLTVEDLRVAFTTTRLRTIDEQRVFLAREKEKSKGVCENANWYVKGRFLVVTGSVKIPLSSIKRLIK